MPDSPQQVPMKVIAHLYSEFPTKFGIPRQSGLAGTRARLVFEPEYRDANALRGLEEFTHLWLIWQFSESVRDTWSPTVRPPRLGGNARMGVFATRSPFRPNAIGLSCVQLERVDWQTPEGPVVWVLGADLMDGTPVFDLKPYLPYTDSHPEAAGGFTDQIVFSHLAVEIPEDLLARIPADRREALRQVLAQDPRPSYQKDPERVYGFSFAGQEIRFCVAGETLRVVDVTDENRRQE